MQTALDTSYSNVQYTIYMYIKYLDIKKVTRLY